MTETQRTSGVGPSEQIRPPRPAIAFLVTLCGSALSYAVAVLFNAQTPIGATADRVIDGVPTATKDWAISTFGTADKLVLGLGIFTTLSLIAWALTRTTARFPTATPLVFAALVFVGFAAQWPLSTGDFFATIAMVIGSGGALWALTGTVVPTREHQRVSGTADQADSAPAQPMPEARWDVSIDRRDFFNRAAGISVGTAMAGGVGFAAGQRRDVQILADAPALPTVSGAASAPVLPTAAPQASGQTPFITPNDSFYRIDTAFSSPRISLDDWSLTIGGMVDNPLTLTYADLVKRDVVERAVTLCCVSNEVGGSLIGNAVWIGVPLRDLLDEVGVQAGADQLASRSEDDWTCGFPTDVALDGRDAMIAIGMNGEPLPIEHGFPARLVVPGLYGYVSATKWIREITLTTWEDFDGYWVPRGWSKSGPVKTHSRIDVPRANERVEPGEVQIAGVAWAQQRGVERVEVRVDGGPWEVATLAEDYSIDTWRQWVYSWDAAPGSYLLEVRATDAAGDVQTGQVARVAPDGATGYHQRTVNVGS